MDDAVELIELYSSLGVERVICTPHYRSPHYDVPVSDAEAAFSLLETRLAELGVSHPALRIGAEVHMSRDFESDLRSDTFPTLCSSRYILVEFPNDSLPDHAIRWVHELRVRGFHPIMAHPERHLEVRRNPKIVKDLIGQGLLMQITASCFAPAEARLGAEESGAGVSGLGGAGEGRSGSEAGGSRGSRSGADGSGSGGSGSGGSGSGGTSSGGPRSGGARGDKAGFGKSNRSKEKSAALRQYEKIAWDILANGHAAVIASDSHGVHRRRPELSVAYDAIEARYGESVVNTLIDNANAIWENRPMSPVTPAIQPTKRWFSFLRG